MPNYANRLMNQKSRNKRRGLYLRRVREVTQNGMKQMKKPCRSFLLNGMAFEEED
jgi:hypothetical protein